MLIQLKYKIENINWIKKGSLALSGFYIDMPTERAASALSLSVFNCYALWLLQPPPFGGDYARAAASNDR